MELHRETLTELIWRAAREQMDATVRLANAPAATTEEEAAERDVDHWDATLDWLAAQVTKK